MNFVSSIRSLFFVPVSTFSSQKIRQTSLPRIAVTYEMNPYDHPQFGDRILGSIAPAYLVTRELGKQFSGCALIGSLERQQDLSKIQIGDEIKCPSEEERSQFYRYKIEIQPDPNSSFIRSMREAGNDVSQIDSTSIQPVMQAILKRGTRVCSQTLIQGKNIVSAITALIRCIPSDETVLVKIPYCTFSPFDAYNFTFAEGRPPLLPSLIDLSNPEIRDQILPCVRPKHAVPKIPFKKGCVPVVMQVRMGDGKDSEPTKLRYPAKFPSLSWYVDATKKLCDYFPKKSLHIHIATDGKASEIQSKLTEGCKKAGLRTFYSLI